MTGVTAGISAACAAVPNYLINPGSQTYSNFTITPTTCTNGIRVDTDRSIYENDNGGFTDRGDWLNASGVASDYEVRFVQNSGDTLSGSSLNTFLALSTDRDLNLVTSGVGTLSADIDVTIRHAIRTAESVTFNVTLSSIEDPPV